jgi:hypothetical protein
MGDGDGVVFPPDDVAALTVALTTVLTSPECWAAARARNRALVLARADRETNLETLGTHYERLVAETGSRPRGPRVAAGAILTALAAAGMHR